MASYKRGRCLIKSLIKQIGITQAELARRTGYTERMISHFANSTKKMSPEAMYIVSSVIGCHMEDLYEWVLE